MAWDQALPDALGGDRASATMARMVLGMTLRRLRESAGLSADDASGSAGLLPGTSVSDIELGCTGVRLRDVAGLCTAYGVSDLAERVTLLGLARQANNPPWWHCYLNLIPAWFERYLELEQAASLIRSYTGQVIPALLQTPDYARAVITLVHGPTPEPDLARRLELLMRRQHILRDPQPPHLWTVIDEAALRRRAGTRTAMRAQLRHLIDACDLAHVTIRVLPFHLGSHPATGGPLAVLRLPDRQLPDIAYLELPATGLYIRTPAQVDYYRHILNQLAIQAGPAGSPQQILAQILRDT